MRHVVSVTLDTKRFTRHLTAAARSQVPYATARALTMTAKDAQADVRTEMTGAMKLRSNWTKRGLRITPARKADGINRMRSEVGHKDWYMAQQMGKALTLRKARTAEYQYIPRGVRKTKTGRIPKAQQPARILTKRNTFMMKTGKDKAAIYRRSRNKLTLMYSAVKQQTIKPSMSLQRTVEATAQRKLQRNWIRSMTIAMNSMKGRR